tara:strand:+ start:347 stop:901 length:555 start_codon:yes stop_codon:yes gene_type:complete
MLITILILSFAFAGFESGMKMFGGSAGFSKDLEEDDTEFYIAPKFGAFISDNLLVEGGLTYYKWEECEDYYNGNTLVEECSDENETVISFGARYFLDKIYFGAEYVPGLTYHMGTPAGTSTVAGVVDLGEGDAEMIIWKVGMMSSIAQNIYLDVGMWLMKYLDDDIDHDGMLNVTAGISYFWKD